jgi:hypothetical protein
VNAQDRRRGRITAMTRRWTKVGTWFGPSKRSMRRAESKIEAVKAVRENRLRHADPADVAKADAVFDELTGEITPDE